MVPKNMFNKICYVLQSRNEERTAYSSRKIPSQLHIWETQINHKILFLLITNDKKYCVNISEVLRPRMHLHNEDLKCIIKCVGGEQNCEGATPGSSNYQRNAKIKSDNFPSSVLQHTFGFQCKEFQSLNPNYLWDQNIFLVHKMNGLGSKKYSHNFLAYVVYIL